MNADPELAVKRREFLKDAARFCVLGALLVGPGILSARGRAPQSCIKRSLCADCAVFEDCVLPQAQEAKRKTTSVLP